MNKVIELTKEELEECKREAADDAVFKYEVLHKQRILFKIINGLPDKVTSMYTQLKSIWGLLFILFSVIIGLCVTCAQGK